VKPQKRLMEPFYFSGNHIGCLLIHGFSGSPAEMRFMGEHLAKSGWTVYGILLSGHAATPEQMSKTSCEDWTEDVEVGVRKLRKSCDTIIGVGLSMGGLLALHLATLGLIDGIVTMNAPMVLDHEDFICEQIPLDALISLNMVISQVRQNLNKIKCPVLLMQSMLDHTVTPVSVEIIQTEIQQVNANVTLWGNSGHILTLGAERKEVALNSRSRSLLGPLMNKQLSLEEIMKIVLDNKEKYMLY